MSLPVVNTQMLLYARYVVEVCISNEGYLIAVVIETFTPSVEDFNEILYWGSHYLKWNSQTCESISCQLSI